MDTAGQVEQVIGELTDAIAKWLVPLRAGEPLDPSRYEAVVAVFRKLEELSRGSTSVPKSLARIMVDLYPQVDGIAGLRARDEPELMAWAEDLLEEMSPLLD